MDTRVILENLWRILDLIKSDNVACLRYVDLSDVVEQLNSKDDSVVSAAVDVLCGYSDYLEDKLRNPPESWREAEEQFNDLCPRARSLYSLLKEQRSVIKNLDWKYKVRLYSIACWILKYGDKRGLMFYSDDAEYVCSAAEGWFYSSLSCDEKKCFLCFYAEKHDVCISFWEDIMKFPAQKANEAMLALAKKAAIPNELVPKLISSIVLDVKAILKATKLWNISQENRNLIREFVFGE